MMVLIMTSLNRQIYHGLLHKLYQVTTLLHLQQNCHGHRLDRINIPLYLDYEDHIHRTKKVESRKLIQTMKRNDMTSSTDGLEWKKWRSMELIWKVNLEDYERRRKVLYGRKFFVEGEKRINI